MDDGMIIFLIVWGLGILFFLASINWHYQRQPDDRLPMWATILIIVFWFISFPVALITLLIIWIDIQYFSDGDD
ncbi:TPA: hypothetical protein RG647_RS12480 [Providencia rettgeri]|nr:hypothetical protein [Providencia rettgeri]